MAESSGPARSGAPADATDEDSDTGANSLDGTAGLIARPAEEGMRGSGLTLEELMVEDSRQHALGRTLPAQTSLGRQEPRLNPEDFPPLIAADGNVHLLDNDATVRPESARPCEVHAGVVDVSRPPRRLEQCFCLTFHATLSTTPT